MTLSICRVGDNNGRTCSLYTHLIATTSDHNNRFVSLCGIHGFVDGESVIIGLFVESAVAYRPVGYSEKSE